MPLHLPFDAVVLRPDGSIGTYSGDIFPSGYVRTRGGHPDYYWHAGDRIVVPKDGILSARLLGPNGEIASDVLAQNAAQLGHKIEVLTEVGGNWLFAGEIVSLLQSPIQFDMLDDWA